MKISLPNLLGGVKDLMDGDTPRQGAAANLLIVCWVELKIPFFFYT